jgi:hypothetical protein
MEEAVETRKKKEEPVTQNPSRAFRLTHILHFSTV